MSGFKEKPSGSVTLWIVGDRKITSEIAAVYGYNADNDTWQVAIYRVAQQNGRHNWTETVLIMKASSGDWMLAPGQHQRVPTTPAEAAAGIS